jgi:hypothetical protein
VFLQPFEWCKYARWRADTQLALALDLAQNFEAETAERIVFDGVFREAFLVLGYQVESVGRQRGLGGGRLFGRGYRTGSQDQGAKGAVAGGCCAHLRGRNDYPE